MKSELPVDPELPPVDARSSDFLTSEAVTAFGGRQSAGYYDPPHSHDRGQFSYRTEGFALVKAGGRAIFLSPGRGVWIPAGVTHEVTCRGAAAYNAFYVERSAAPQVADVRIIAVTPLLHAMVEALIHEREADALRRQRLADLILDEVARAPDIGVLAPTMPFQPGLRAICDRLSRDPAMPLDLDAWAVQAGMSRRSFTRLFRDETGLSPGEWHMQLRMHFADTWLAQDIPLQKVSFRLGYRSVAGFARAYARTFGAPPKDHRSNL
jgi:AraC-like DNA-binding protein/mannose-6-phosphate isomerase-like protein (cupin superfamily)